MREEWLDAIDTFYPPQFTTSKVLAPLITQVRRQQSLLETMQQRNFKPMGNYAAQAQLASESFQRAVGPLLEWAKKPRVRSELFMFRRTVIGDKFSKMVTTPISELLGLLHLIAESTFPQLGIRVTQRRAQIMSIRGMALSCAPNFSPISDINLFSRLHRGIA